MSNAGYSPHPQPLSRRRARGDRPACQREVGGVGVAAGAGGRRRAAPIVGCAAGSMSREGLVTEYLR